MSCPKHDVLPHNWHRPYHEGFVRHLRWFSETKMIKVLQLGNILKVCLHMLVYISLPVKKGKIKDQISRKPSQCHSVTEDWKGVFWTMYSELAVVFSHLAFFCNLPHFTIALPPTQLCFQVPIASPSPAGMVGRWLTTQRESILWEVSLEENIGKGGKCN